VPTGSQRGTAQFRTKVSREREGKPLPEEKSPRVGKIISAIERIADGAMTRRVDGTKEMF
jgi:hypothetical protein